MKIKRLNVNHCKQKLQKSIHMEQQKIDATQNANKSMNETDT